MSKFPPNETLIANTAKQSLDLVGYTIDFKPLRHTPSDLSYRTKTGMLNGKLFFRLYPKHLNVQDTIYKSTTRYCLKPNSKEKAFVAWSGYKLPSMLLFVSRYKEQLAEQSALAQNWYAERETLCYIVYR